MGLEPQAALEQAVVNAIIGASFGFTKANCGRQADGRPPPSVNPEYLSVWSPADRTSSQRTKLDEVFKVHVTMTARVQVAYDKRVLTRDRIELVLNAVRALIHKDCNDFSIVNAANELATFGYTQAQNRPVGFCEGLALVRWGPIEEKAESWFQATAQVKGNPAIVALAQTVEFGYCRRVQAVLTAS